MDTYTVIRPFKTRLRRFAAGQVAGAADLSDDALGLAACLAAGLVAPVDRAESPAASGAETGRPD